MMPMFGCPRRSGRGASRRPAPLGPVWLVLCLMIVAARPVLAAGQIDPRLELGVPSVRGDHVWLHATVAHLLQGEVLDALHAGLPATVVFEWRIRQRQPGWRDRQVIDGATVYRIFYDVLQNRYNVFDYRGRPIAFLNNLPEIERSISDLPGLKLIAASELSASRTYYVEVRASVELLNEEEVGRLNEWLTGSDREKKRFDVVGYLSGRLSRALGDMIGPANGTVVSRTADFAGFSR
jgi:hypothetical protein